MRERLTDGCEKYWLNLRVDLSRVVSLQNFFGIAREPPCHVLINKYAIAIYVCFDDSGSWRVRLYIHYVTNHDSMRGKRKKERCPELVRLG